MGVSARQLEAFRALLECATVTAAAERLCISQPAVSRMLERFQDEVGFKVFEKVSGKLRPTAEAQIFYDEVRRVYQGLSHLDKVAKDLSSNARGEINIGVIAVLSGQWIADAAAAFIRTRPDVFVSITGVPTRDVQAVMSAQRLDVAFAALPVDDPFLDCELVQAFESVCIFPDGHELASKQVVGLKDLEGLPFISLAPVDGSRTHIDNLFDQHGVKRTISMEIALSSTICAMVARGAGVSVVARQAAVEHRHLGLQWRPITPTSRFPVYMLRSKLRPKSALVDSFVATMKAQLGQVGPEAAAAG